MHFHRPKSQQAGATNGREYRKAHGDPDPDPGPMPSQPSPRLAQLEMILASRTKSPNLLHLKPTYHASH